MHFLTLYASIPQNGQTHSNNSSGNLPTYYLSVFDHFVGLVLKGLIILMVTDSPEELLIVATWPLLYNLTTKKRCSNTASLASSDN